VTLKRSLPRGSLAERAPVKKLQAFLKAARESLALSEFSSFSFQRRSRKLAPAWVWASSSVNRFYKTEVGRQNGLGRNLGKVESASPAPGFEARGFGNAFDGLEKRPWGMSTGRSIPLGGQT